MLSSQAQSTLDQLRALEDPKTRAVNQRHGDDHGVKLSELRAVAKQLGHDPQLAAELWGSGDGAGRLVAILASKPRDFSTDQLDAMLSQANTPKSIDWLVNYLAKKSPHAEQLRLRWLGDDRDVVQAAGWALTSDRVAKGRADGLDLPALLDTIEHRMAHAPERTQWGMNETLAQIGINHPELRPRAIAIGERLGVLKDYPTPPGCTSPYAPIWIGEMVRRQLG